MADASVLDFPVSSVTIQGATVVYPVGAGLVIVVCFGFSVRAAPGVFTDEGRSESGHIRSSSAYRFDGGPLVPRSPRCHARVAEKD